MSPDWSEASPWQNPAWLENERVSIPHEDFERTVWPFYSATGSVAHVVDPQRMRRVDTYAGGWVLFQRFNDGTWRCVPAVLREDGL